MFIIFDLLSIQYFVCVLLCINNLSCLLHNALFGFGRHKNVVAEKTSMRCICDFVWQEIYSKSFQTKSV
jgi:hypothetical protein